MNIGITGCKGFIGSAVAAELAAAGHAVVPLDDYLRGEAAMDSSPRDRRWILHFAARTSIPESLAEPLAFYRDNLDATLKALQLAHRSGAALLLMSSYVYGVPKYHPLDERHPLSPENPYMASKIAGEMVCGHFSKLLGIPLLIFRAFHIYGDCSIPGRLISDLLECVRKGDRLRVNDPDARRDYVYVRDFSELVLKVVSMSPPPTGVFNVGSGSSYSNREVAELIGELSGDDRRPEFRHCPRAHDVPECTADITAIKAAFGWTPRYGLRAGLGELIRGIQNASEREPQT